MPGFNSVATLVNSTCARHSPSTHIAFFGQPHDHVPRSITLPPVSSMPSLAKDSRNSKPSQPCGNFGSARGLSFDSVARRSKSARLLFKDRECVKKDMQKLSFDFDKQQRRLHKLEETIQWNLARTDRINDELLLLAESRKDCRHVSKKTENQPVSAKLETQLVSKKNDRQRVATPSFGGKQAVSIPDHHKLREWELQCVKLHISKTIEKLKEFCDEERACSEEVAVQMDHLRMELRDIEAEIIAQKEKRKEKSQAVAAQSMPTTSAVKRKLSCQTYATSGITGDDVTFDSLRWSDLDAETATEISRYSPRTAIELALTQLSGSQIGAFRRLDTNRCGQVSLTEFIAGLDVMEVPWKTFLLNNHIEARPEKLFALFHCNQHGLLSAEDIFSNVDCDDSSVEMKTGKKLRAPTPESWKKWCLRSDTLRSDERKPKWWVDRTSLQEVVRNRVYVDNVAARRDWMQQTMHRLRNRGVTGAACRELVALHLPRGQGPKGREGCKLLDKGTVHSLRKQYMEETIRPLKRIQKVLFDISSQRADFSKMRMEFANMTEGVNLAQKEEEDRRTRKGHSDKAVAAREGFIEHDPTKMTEEEKQLSRLAREVGLPDSLVHEVFYMLLAVDCNPATELSREEFGKFISESTLARTDTNTLWKSAMKHGSRRASTAESDKFIQVALDINKLDDISVPKTISFMQLMKWYATKKPTNPVSARLVG